MPVKTFYLISAAILFAQSAWADRATSLTVDADPAVAAIKPLVDGRRLLRPPDLEFLLRIGAKCDADTEVASISISIADTNTALTAADLADTAPVATSITIPARQLSPIAVENFCTFDAPNSGDNLEVRDALTAHVSLRCANEEHQSITYATHALHVMLQCDVAAEAQGETPSLIAR